MMKTFILLACLSTIGLATLSAQTPAEKRQPAFYTPFTLASPFTVAPPPDPSKLPPANPLDNWALSGYVTVGPQVILLLQNKQNPAIRITIVSGEPNEHKIQVVSVEAGNTYKEAKALVKLEGTETQAILTFDPNQLKITRPNGPAPGAPAPQPQPKK